MSQICDNCPLRVVNTNWATSNIKRLTILVILINVAQGVELYFYDTILVF